MSVAAARESAEVGERDLGFDPGLGLTPLVQTMTIDTGYSGAVISLAGDPDAPNAAERIKGVLIVASSDELLQPRILACLISEFGLSQDDAEQVPQVVLVADTTTAARPQAAPAPQAPSKAPPPRTTPTKGA